MGQNRQTGQVGQGRYDRATGMGQPWQDSAGGTAGKGLLRQDSRDMSLGYESNTRTAASGELWTRLLGQYSWHRTAGIGLPGCDIQNRTAGTGQPGRTVRTVHPGLETEDKNNKTGKQEKESKKRTARTGQEDRTTVTG